MKAKTPLCSFLILQRPYIWAPNQVIVHMIRTDKIPFIPSMLAAPVLLLTMLIMAIGIGIPYAVFGKGVGLVAPGGELFPMAGDDPAQLLRPDTICGALGNGSDEARGG